MSKIAVFEEITSYNYKKVKKLLDEDFSIYYKKSDKKTDNE